MVSNDDTHGNHRELAIEVQRSGISKHLVNFI
jgi:hypothetical protein